MSDKPNTCCCDALTAPDSWNPKGTKNFGRITIRDSGRHSATVGDNGLIAPLDHFRTYYFTNLIFPSGGDKNVFENFRAQLKEQYQQQLDNAIEKKAGEAVEYADFYQKLITFLQNVVDSV